MKRETLSVPATPVEMDRKLPPLPAWRRNSRYWSIGLAVAVAVICAWLLAAHNRTYRVSVNSLTFGIAKRVLFEDFISVRASAVPFATQYLTADQGGTVKEVLAEDGATVRAGQPVILLTNTALQLQVASREADTAAQVNALENTKLQLEQTRFRNQHDLLDIDHLIGRLEGALARDKILLEGNAIAPATYKQEEEEYEYEKKLREASLASGMIEQRVRANQLVHLRETLARLSESVSTARASLEALTVRAASDGQLTALNAEVGQSKPQGAVLGEIDSLDRFKLTAQVDEFHLGRVRLNQAALFSIDRRNYTATVSKIYPQITNGTFKVDLHFTEGAPLSVHAGQAVDIKLKLGGADNALTLPNGPFYQDTGGHWAFVLTPDGKYATRRSIRLGRRNPEYVEVLEGLLVGEKVIISGYGAFQNVDRVELAKRDRNN